MSEWKENTGEVPEEVTEYTIVRVKYRNGLVTLWYPTDLIPNNSPSIWSIEGIDLDVVEYQTLGE